jgi:hypothetical protein
MYRSQGMAVHNSPLDRLSTRSGSVILNQVDEDYDGNKEDK